MAEPEKEINDMKYEIIDLKKKFHNISAENHMLKIKSRKLQADLEKKNKHIETLIDPRKSSCVRKILTERGASLIVDLKKRNTELMQAIEAKDAYIKKIQTELQTSKTYMPSDILHNKNVYCRHKSLKNTENNTSRINSSRSRSLSVTPTPSSIFKVPNDILATQHLEENIEKIKLASINSLKGRPLSENTVEKKTNLITKKNNSASLMNDKNISNLDKLLKEMETMKGIVFKLSIEQEQTKKILKEKKSMEFLTRQVKQLQKNKFRKSSGTIVLQITNDKNGKIETKLNSSSYSQESFEEDDDSKNSNQLKNISGDNLKNTGSDNEDDNDVATRDS